MSKKVTKEEYGSLKRAPEANEPIGGQGLESMPEELQPAAKQAADLMFDHDLLAVKVTWACGHTFELINPDLIETEGQA